MKNDVIILGVGNPMRQDDGIGPAILEVLQEKELSGADVIDGGIDGLALLDLIAEYRHAIIIDAIDMQASPGAVKVFAPEQAKIVIKSDALSTHGFGLAEVIKLAQELDFKVELTIVGVQPLAIDFGEGLSEVVASQMPEIVKIVLSLYHKHLS